MIPQKVIKPNEYPRLEQEEEEKKNEFIENIENLNNEDIHSSEILDFRKVHKPQIYDIYKSIFFLKEFSNKRFIKSNSIIAQAMDKFKEFLL